MSNKDDITWLQSRTTTTENEIGKLLSKLTALEEHFSIEYIEVETSGNFGKYKKPEYRLIKK